MQRFKNILLFAGGVSRQEEALDRAGRLAGSNNAGLTVMDVIEELPPEMGMLVASARLEDLRVAAVTARLEQLEDLIAPVREKGVHVTARVLIGTPFLEIIREVLRNKHDLVMKTATGKKGLKEMLFGDTAMHLIRKCPCPVWVMKPPLRKGYASVLAAVDPDPTDKERDALNTKIMELATSLARIEGSELHIAHAWRLAGETLLLGPGLMSRSEVGNLARKSRTEHEKLIAELVKQHDPCLPKSRVHLLKGFAGDAIPSLARRKGIGIIVMGTVCRTGIAGFLIGSTAENVLRRVNCSVLTVKPDGFVTPVELS